MKTRFFTGASAADRRLQRTFIDLKRPPPNLARNPLAVQTAFYLNSQPDLNFDGDPSRFAWQELQASLAHPYVTADAKQQLQWVAEAFFETDAQPLGLPPDRAYVRDLLIQRGLQVFSDPYPPDLPIPPEVRQLNFRMPFKTGTTVSVQQGNNTMYSPATHAPNKLRYALDFVIPRTNLNESKGLPVTAPAGGIAYVYGNARENQPDNWGFGNFVLIDHGNGYATMLSHLDKMSVKTGQRVAAGQGVGQVGLTGNAGNAHLHLQLVRLTKRPDPANEEHQWDFNNPSPNIPAFPFDITVPFEVPVIDLTAGTARAPRKIKSTEFRGGEAGTLPEYAGTYQVPAETDG